HGPIGSVELACSRDAGVSAGPARSATSVIASARARRVSSPGPYRLKTQARGRPVAFRFDGRPLQGLEGDTVASALLANGFRVVSRSFKYHRPRGIFSAGYEEPNALIQLHSGSHAIPCARATLTPLSPGLEVSSQVGWPSVSFDVL